MSVIVYTAWICYVFSIAFAWRRGGSPERYVATIIFTGAIATIAVRDPWISRYAGAEHGVMLVDLLVLAAMGAVALRAVRFWPIPVTSLHALTVASHFARLADAAASPTIYAIMATLSGFTVPFVLIAGTNAHRRRLQRVGVDPSWRRSSPGVAPTQQHYPNG